MWSTLEIQSEKESSSGWKQAKTNNILNSNQDLMHYSWGLNIWVVFDSRFSYVVVAVTFIPYPISSREWKKNNFLGMEFLRSGNILLASEHIGKSLEIGLCDPFVYNEMGCANYLYSQFIVLFCDFYLLLKILKKNEPSFNILQHPTKV